MAHKYEAEISEVITAIRGVVALAQTNLAETPAFRDRITAALRQQDNYLSHVIGAPLQDAPATKKFGPIFLPKRDLNEQPQVIKSAAAMEGDQLKADVDSLMPHFADRDTSELKDALTDIQVRGVAKRVGFKVTDTEPEYITLEYIEEIKEKIISDRSKVQVVEKSMKAVDGEATTVTKTIPRKKNAV